MKQVGPIRLAQARRGPGWRRYISERLLSAGGVALVTGLITLAHLYPRVPTISLVYLIVVLAVASTRGLYAAILASLLSFLAFDFFFVPPPQTFIVAKFEDLLTLVVFLAAAVTTGQLASALRHSAEEARSRERELRVLYEQAKELAALQERQRLARELHDSISQVLYSMSLGAHTIRESLESNEAEQAMASTDYVISLAEAGLVEMRALIFELRPQSLESEGLVAAVTRHIAVLRVRYKLSVEANLGEEPELSLEVKQALYRIAQEALHNIVRHARAGTVELKLAREGQQIILEVRDDGRGFDSKNSFPGHLGLRSMQERAAQVHGSLTIESTPGQGTCIHVEVPVPTEDEAQVKDALRS